MEESKGGGVKPGLQCGLIGGLKEAEAWETRGAAGGGASCFKIEEGRG
jgi:hypothetical protein